MKTNALTRLLLAFTAILLFTATTLYAVPIGPTFSFHENGTGKLVLPNGVVIPILSTLTADPGPGGLSSALAFVTHPQESPFATGNVLLLDPLGTVSDVIRFSPATSDSSGFTQLIFFYSNDHGGLLADTGLPSGVIFAPTAIQESEGATIYTPIVGQPGFEAGFPLPVTYQFFSTPDTGSSLLLLSFAIVGITLLRRKLLTG